MREYFTYVVLRFITRFSAARSDISKLLSRLKPSSEIHLQSDTITLRMDVIQAEALMGNFLGDNRDAAFHFYRAYKGIVVMKRAAPPLKPILNTSDILEF